MDQEEERLRGWLMGVQMRLKAFIQIDVSGSLCTLISNIKLGKLL